ncbi:MAG: hypothetical protein QGH06_00430 [Lutibacter sp.]|jgi:hypothetical protein|nr:hypothetical protein [Lutibacter sp.]
MKKLLHKGLLITAMFIGVVGKANDNELRITVNSVDSKLIQVSFSNNDGDLALFVKDLSGRVLYEEDFKGTYYAKQYNCSRLPSGTYYFEVSGATKITKIPFEVSDSNVLFNHLANTVYYKPTVRVKDRFVYVDKLSLNNQPMSLSLFGGEEQPLYSELLQGSIYQRRVLDLSRQPAGQYTLVLESEGQQFVRDVNIP